MLLGCSLRVSVDVRSIGIFQALHDETMEVVVEENIRGEPRIIVEGGTVAIG